MYEPKIISKESIHLFTPKFFLVDYTKIKIAGKGENKSPSTPVKKLKTSLARKLFLNKLLTNI